MISGLDKGVDVHIRVSRDQRGCKIIVSHEKRRKRGRDVRSVEEDRVALVLFKGSRCVIVTRFQSTVSTERRGVHAT